MASVNQDDPRPPYVQIADELRSQIMGGGLKPGQRVESGRTMAQRFGVAPMTVHNALGLLREEGLLVSWQGRGVYVADPLPTADAAPGDILSKLDAVYAEVGELRQRVAALEDQRPG